MAHRGHVIPRRDENCTRRSSDFVENPLGDLALTDLAPLPVTLPDELVEMLVGRPDAPEPDLGLLVADLLQFGAAGEVEEIRQGA